MLKRAFLVSRKQQNKHTEENFFFFHLGFEYLSRWGRGVAQRGHGQTSMVSRNLLWKCTLQAGPLSEQGLSPHLSNMALPAFWCPSGQMSSIRIDSCFSKSRTNSSVPSPGQQCTWSAQSSSIFGSRASPTYNSLSSVLGQVPLRMKYRFWEH